MFVYFGRFSSKNVVLTLEEGIVYASLKKSSLFFRKQFNPLASLTRVDFYVPSKKLCIFVDGVYWHKDRREIDNRKTKILEAAGYKVLRVSDGEVRRLGVDGFLANLEKEHGSFGLGKLNGTEQL